jgi:hypothetical protein
MMPIGFFNQGHGLSAVHNSQNRLEQAASQVAKASVAKDAESKPSDLFKAVTDVKRAGLENQAAVKLLESEKETLGGFIDEVA